MSTFLLLGQALAEMIVKEVALLGLDMKNCRGQAYDGAANTAGAIRGASTIILKDYPLAKYQHCGSHILNLSLMKACTSISDISECFYTKAFFQIISYDNSLKQDFFSV